MFRTIRFKVLIVNLVFLLATFWGIMFVIYQTAYSMLRTHEMRYNVEASNRTMDNFSFVIDSVHRAARNLQSNTALLNLLRDDTLQTEEDFTQARNTASNLLKETIYNSPYLSAIHVLGVKSWQFFSSIPSVDEKPLKALCQPLLAGAETTRRQSFYTSDYQLEYYPGVNRTVIEYVFPVYNIDTSRLLAAYVIDIDYDALEEMFLLSSMENEDKALVVDNNGAILFNYPYNVTLNSVLKDYPQLMVQKEMQFTGTVFGTEMFIVSNTIKETNWHIIRMLSLSRITRDTQYLSRLMSWVTAGVVAVCVLLSVLLSSAITANITRLSKAFHRAENGDLTTRVHIRSKDELGKLGDSFNMMIQKLDSHLKLELEESQKKSDMELQVLQAQVNPHFLYNTLDSIKWLAMLQSVDNIAEMTTALIHLLRYNLSKEGPIVTLADEIESVKNYICVQKYRYGDGFALWVNTPPETLNCQMPRFILQPLVENCILHAFAHKVTQGTITLRATLEAGVLHIFVIDNGEGMDVEKVLDRLEKGDRFKNIGVNNLRERIRLNYGTAYGLTYRSDKSGTTAEITLPERHSPPGKNSEIS
ncbi:MAG: sensor histidine kinase [Clostridiales bacterium]|nr:sensor histidine kinase [Clostridiales bacterium]